MDTLFIGDIPKEYHYALFNNGYIDLYNTPNLTNGTYNYYRVYTNSGGFYYRLYSTNYGQYNTTYAQEIKVTDNICYRQDFSNICIITFIIVFFAVFLFNIFTSSIRKGGLLGGLLWFIILFIL